MINRSIIAAVADMMKYYPIVAITGPRQSGKTTMLRRLLPDFKYISFEDPDNRQYFSKDPRGFLAVNNSKIIFDEAQLVPELFSYLQTKVDTDNLMGQFILSGSQNFNLLNNISQSLAGRVALLKLLPFDTQELAAANLLPTSPYTLMLRGCYPTIYDRNTPTSAFYGNYIETYVERDLQALLKVKDLRLFRTFLKLCAGRVGQLLNLTNLSNEAGVSLITVKSWLSILESSYILYQLPPFYNNFNKRLVKSTKLYFYDTGLVCHLLGIKTEQSLQQGPFAGALFENLVINEYQKQNYHHNQLRDLYYWRDSNGHEVDLLVSNGPAYDIVEIKATSTIMPSLFAGLDLLASIGGSSIARKVLVYSGPENQPRTQYQVWSWRSVAVDF
jgi:uncharacterized protein